MGHGRLEFLLVIWSKLSIMTHFLINTQTPIKSLMAILSSRGLLKSIISPGYDLRTDFKIPLILRGIHTTEQVCRYLTSVHLGVCWKFLPLFCRHHYFALGWFLMIEGVVHFYLLFQQPSWDRVLTVKAGLTELLCNSVQAGVLREPLWFFCLILTRYPALRFQLILLARDRFCEIACDPCAYIPKVIVSYGSEIIVIVIVSKGVRLILVIIRKNTGGSFLRRVKAKAVVGVVAAVD